MLSARQFDRDGRPRAARSFFASSRHGTPLLAFLAASYGRQILRRMAEYRQPVLLFGIAAAVAATLYVLVRYKRSKRPSHSH